MVISNISNSHSLSVSSPQAAGTQVGKLGAQRPPPPSGGMPGPKGPAGAGGALPAAVTQTLAKLGILDTESSLNSTDESSATQSDSAKVQAIGDFMLDLMGALHAQHEQGGTAQAQAEGGDDPQVLEQSFLSLLSALGASDSQVSLKDFLTALSESGVGSSGNVIDTLA